MLLYFSSDKNISIFDEEAKTLGIDVKIETERCLTDYIKRNMSKLNHLEFLAIDLEYIIDDDTEILNTLSNFKVFNSKIEIIIVSFEREKGDILLGKLFSNGIYNFITSKDTFEMNREINNSLSLKNNYANAIGYKIEESNKFSKEKEKNTWFKNILSNLKKDNIEKFINKSKNNEKKKGFIKYKKSIQDNFEEKSIDFKNHKFEEKENSKDNPKSYEEQTIKSNNNKDEEIQISKEQLVQDKISEIFGNDNFLSKKEYEEKNRDKLELEYIDDTTALFYYYGKAIGLYSKNDNGCVIDSLFEKDDIKDYLLRKKINFIFKKDTIIKIKELKGLYKGGGCQR